MAFYFFPAFAQAERRKDFCSYGSLSTYVLIVSFFPFLSISCHLRGSLVSLLHTPTHPPCLYPPSLLVMRILYVSVFVHYSYIHGGAQLATRRVSCVYAHYESCFGGGHVSESSSSPGAPSVLSHSHPRYIVTWRCPLPRREPARAAPARAPPLPKPRLGPRQRKQTRMRATDPPPLAHAS